MHMCLNIVEVLYSVKVDTNIGTIGGGSNCNWYGVLDATSVIDPFGIDRAPNLTRELYSQYLVVDAIFRQYQFINIQM